jgi:hypothetical protein
VICHPNFAEAYDRIVLTKLLCSVSESALILVVEQSTIDYDIKFTAKVIHTGKSYPQP